MKLKITPCFLLSLTLNNSCQTDHKESHNEHNVEKRLCGYELSMDEWNEIQKESVNINPYLTENSSEIFLEIYDSVKKNVDSSLVYELTLTKLKAGEIWLDLTVPKIDRSVEDIVCTIMNTRFSSSLPP